MFVNCNVGFINNPNIIGLKTIKINNNNNYKFKNNLLILRCNNELKNQLTNTNKCIHSLNIGILGNYACGNMNISSPTLIVLYSFLLYFLILKLFLTIKIKE